MSELGSLLLLLVVGLVRGNRQTSDRIKDQYEEGDSGIRCPACRWQPARHDVWACNPGCGLAWNTFETRGRCPECGKQWEMTQCPKCGTWSAHEAWYERP